MRMVELGPPKAHENRDVSLLPGHKMLIRRPRAVSCNSRTVCASAQAATRLSACSTRRTCKTSSFHQNGRIQSDLLRIFTFTLTEYQIFEHYQFMQGANHQLLRSAHQHHLVAAFHIIGTHRVNEKQAQMVTSSSECTSTYHMCEARVRWGNSSTD